MTASAALDLARRGLSVFPLRHIIRRDDGGGFICSCGAANCHAAGKHPHPNLAPNGCKNATADIAKVDWWWRAAPDANIGIATGEIVVIDVDPRHGGDEAFQRIEPRLPPTWRVHTGGGGLHLYFRNAGNREIRNSAGLIGAGIDVRGVGGFVVGAGSNHISGGVYAWDVDAHPDDTPLAPLPDWLFPSERSSGTQPVPNDWQSIIGGAPEGKRNHTIAKLAGHLFCRNVDAFLALDLLQAWNACRCSPPLEPDEVAAVVASISKAELRKAAS
jgi:bifunctional DNA primase/polymerase-like protein/primase-like protein